MTHKLGDRVAIVRSDLRRVVQRGPDYAGLRFVWREAGETVELRLDGGALELLADDLSGVLAGVAEMAYLRGFREGRQGIPTTWNVVTGQPAAFEAVEGDIRWQPVAIVRGKL